jgi:hypothetical protein
VSMAWVLYMRVSWGRPGSFPTEESIIDFDRSRRKSAGRPLAQRRKVG